MTHGVIQPLMKPAEFLIIPHTRYNFLFHKFSRMFFFIMIIAKLYLENNLSGFQGRIRTCESCDFTLWFHKVKLSKYG